MKLLQSSETEWPFYISLYDFSRASGAFLCQAYYHLPAFSPALFLSDETLCPDTDKQTQVD